MRIKKSPSSAKRLAHMPPSLINFISTLETCPQSDIAKRVRSFGPLWDQPRGDLHHWIPVLNRFDEILETAVTKSGLRANLPSAYVFSAEEEEMLVAILDFSALLLEECSHRSLYASGSYLSHLLYATSLPILISTLKVCARLAQRYAQANSGRSSIFVISLEKMYKLANSFPPPTPVEITHKVSLYDLVDPSKDWDSSWSSIHLQYYKNIPASLVSPETPGQPVTPSLFTPQKGEASVELKAGDGMLSFTASSNEVAHTSMDGLLNRVFTEIPKHFLVEAFLKTRTAKAFAPGPASLEMRRQLAAVRCLAIEFLGYTAQENSIQTRLFAGNPQLIGSLCDLIHPDNDVPVWLRTFAIESLQSLAHHRAKHNEILSSLSANVNHGVLLYIVRQMVKDLSQGQIVDAYFADRLMNLIPLLASSSHSVQVLVTAGFMSVMVQLIETKTPDLTTVAMAITVIQHMVCVAQSAFNEFVQIGGLDFVVKRIEEEVDYSIANPEDIEQTILVDYKINYVRAQFIKSLFKLLLSMMASTGNADRLRNLVESSILSSIKKIVSNSSLFGTNIVSCAIDMMSTFIHNEPTSYTIISESKLPQVFVDSIPELIKLSKTTSIPHAIGAICLNNAGLDLVQTSGALKKYFQVFKMHFHAQIMTLTSVPSSLGSAFDEMVRHHPALKEEIMAEVVQIAADICHEGETMPGGVRFFSVRADALKTDADEDLVTQDANSEIMSLIDCYARFLEAFLQNNVHCKEFIKRDGLAYLVRFYSLPSLPYDFPSRAPAISLTRVFRLATEVNTFWTVTTILKACSATMKNIDAFLDYNEPESFFKHLETENGDFAAQFMKSLNSVHCFVFLLSQMYAHMIYPHSKSTLPMIQPFSTVNEFEQLLVSFGRLQRNCLWEDIVITKGLSEEWRDASRVISFDESRNRYNEQERKTEIAEAEAKIDVTDNRYKNVKIVRYMMSQIPGSLSKIFSGLSKLTLSRRIPDASQKKHGFSVGEMLAKVLVESLSYSRIDLFQDKRDKYAYWVLLLSASRNILFDDQRVSTTSLLTVVAICFKRQGGIELLIKVLESLWYELRSLPPAEDGDKSILSKQAMTFGDVVVLQIFSTLVNMKSVLDSSQTGSLAMKERDRDRPEYFNQNQFLVELRLALLPTIKKLWESEELLNATSPVLKILVGILASIMNSDGENGCLAPGDRAWSSDRLTAASFQAAEDGVRQLMDLGFARPLVEVALRRSSNQVNRAADLLIANRSGLSYGSGAETPLGIGEVGSSTQPSEVQGESSADGAAAAVALAALIDPDMSNTPAACPDIESDDIDIEEDPEDIETAERDIGDRSASESDASDGDVDFSGEPVVRDGEDTPMAEPESSMSSTVAAHQRDEVSKVLYVSDLNEIREEIRKDLIPRTLTILEAHPEVVFELSNLLNASFGGKLSSVETKKQTVAEIVRHLSSFDLSDENNIVRVKSTAHLLGLHLQNEAFFAASLADLRTHWDLFIRLLHFDRNGNDSWIPDVLLIVERILSDAEQPRPVTFEHNLSGPIVELDQVPMETREALFDAIVKLPTVKSEATAAAVARVLIILTRDHDCAVEAFEKGAIGSLFTSIQNISGDSKLRLQNYASILLRHVIDSSETLETLIAIEIRSWFSQPRARPVDVQSFIRGNSHAVVRSPQTFVKVTNNICKVVLSPEIPSRQQNIILKSQQNARPALPGSDISHGDGNEMKKMEDEDREMTDAKPTADTPLPIKVLTLEKTTGVMQYLLNELFATKDDPPQQPEKTDSNDKMSDQTQKVEFNASKHPQFLYRAFLLEVVTELLASYNQCKLEFISYSRRGQTFSTPSKPRLAVLNYFLYELLPTGGLVTSDDIQFKKKVCISNMTVRLLYALVTGTGEQAEHGEEDFTVLHIRKFVLDATLRAFKDVSTSTDPLEVRYSRLLNLGTLCYKFLNGRTSNSMVGGPKNTFAPTEVDDSSMAKIMFEKGFVSTLTNALNEIDLNFPGSQKVVRVLLRPLTKLARASIDLADVLTMTKPGGLAEEDYFSTDSGPDDYREETPNFFSNSALGMYEVEEGADYDDDASEISGTDDGGEDMEYEEDDDEEDADEEVMEFVDEEMDYDDDEEDSEDDLTEEGEDDVVDDDDDHMNVEIVVEEIHHDEDSDGDENVEGEQSAEEDDDDELDAESIQDYDDDDEWQDELDGDGIGDFGDPLDEIARVLGDEGDTPEQEGEVDEDEEDDEEPEDGEESDDVVPTDDMDYADDIEQDGDDEPNFGWEIEEIGTYDDMFPSRRNPHMLSNTGIRGSGIPGWSDVDTATNPLLVQPPNEEITSALSGSGVAPNDLPYRPYYSRRLPTEGDLRVLNDLFQQVVRHHHHRAGNSGEFGGNDVIITSDVDPVFGYHPSRSNRQSREDPWAIVSTLSPKPTLVRWQEEARMLFSTTVNDKASQVINHILNILLPIAIKEDEERKAAEAEDRRKERERLEREEQERREQERVEAERKAAEGKAAEEAEALARQQAEETASSAHASAVEEGSPDDSKNVEMEDVESSAVAEDATAPAGVSSEPRVIVMVGGREVDVTGMGIDPTFLEALPEDMREEVLASHIREMQSSSTPHIGEPESEIEAEFLAALPPNIRQELLQQEAAERRRLQRERELREAPAENPTSDMDFATFLATLDPALRQTILAEQDEEALAHLPPTIADEAHELQRRHNLHTINDFLEIEPPARGSNGHRLHRLSGTQVPDGPGSSHPTSRNGIQLVDRAGVASLVRLLYLPQTSSQRSPLYDMLVSVTSNRQSRAELFNMILSILQDGSTDVISVERSYNQIWARARPQHTAVSNTPTKPLATPKTSVMSSAKGNIWQTHHGSAEVSPLVLAQQCLQALDHIIKSNRQLASYFLIEHESPIGMKRTTSRKGKLKDIPASKSHKYAINTLLALLDRPMIRDSATAMDILSMLFQEITRPLQVLVKRSMEEEKAMEGEQEVEGEHGVSSDPIVATAEVTEKDEAQSGQSTSAAKDEESKQPQRKLSPPFIPEHNLCLLVNILTARECPNRTLQQTLAAMQNLSAVPGAKDIFGSELIRQAQELGRSLPHDLQELKRQIKQARSGSEIQGMALSRFSPASSDQAKLLRVLTAVDYLFDPEREKKDVEGMADNVTDDVLIKLYSGLDFGLLWKALGEVLREIQERSDMLHVATVLLPLIEAFMVVCKHEVLKETPKPTQPPGKVVRLDMAPVNHPPDNMQHLFFKFTDDHRKILNQMVRNNPKLMSGSFSILVKNPKVLDFDNKRNFFNRQLHARSQVVHIHRALALNVRREQVFLDSYKAMYFKTGDEIKYSKLNIRFHGEEGVDAGGVTREWFQVLARQMFNPDYALFTPVASDRTTFHPNRTSGVNPEHLLFFKFIGRIIGKALYEGRVLDCHFSRAVYKRILGKQVSLKDMETLDLEYYKSLVWMLENDITDVITETMSLEADDYGDKKIIDLVPNGRDISVTEENKHEYVRLVVGYRLLTSVEEQLESFLNGFYDIVPKDLIAIFNEQELELLISGLPDIDVDDWRNNTVYQNYSPSSPQIQWFWRAVRSFDAEERAKLLQFVTGTSKVPLNGFSELEGMNGVSRFSIHRDYGHKHRLPSSHTCFNQLDMPEYESYEALRNALLLAITEGREGFGFA
ncbi:hypothetical protein V1508DRAFT_464960 [Lipomyces doorenjongii]|uniref:uncharacterized protein n=1 Tax=Lipomyces doorenjongii TaxID=383834 RepID=UPI0034D00963